MEFMFNILQHICRLPMGDYLQLCYKILFFTIIIVCSMEVKVCLSSFQFTINVIKYNIKSRNEIDFGLIYM